jgi:hypothetical protein
VPGARPPALGKRADHAYTDDLRHRLRYPVAPAMTPSVYQLVIGDHLARSVRGVPCAPPGAVIDLPDLDDTACFLERSHGRPV